MGKLDFDTLRVTNVQRCVFSFEHALRDWSLSDWIVALGGEVGEGLNVIKKLNRERDGFGGNTKSLAELEADFADELADAVLYLDLSLAREGLPLCDWAKDFAQLQLDAVNRLRDEDAGYSLSDAGRDLFISAGRLAEASTSLTGAGSGLGFATAARKVLEDLACLAELARCDLGAAVARKFNATSQKRGAPERLPA
ncbi:MAG: hypothetical protein EOP24_34305 [Hyphomicrobiales bacterium]|nr:MAG: hypothetical protein EOP24_34305 [Hyphomicrobiales bacterium]